MRYKFRYKWNSSPSQFANLPLDIVNFSDTIKTHLDYDTLVTWFGKYIICMLCYIYVYVYAL